MSQTPADRLVALLALERESDDAFVGQATGGGRRLFGGLVAAQAVIAAGHTVTDAELHSLHAYFLRPGRPDVPIGYAVAHTKEGRTFRVRSVLATQGEEIIFTLHASFARPEPGVTHQDQMPEAPPPEGLPDRDRLRGRANWAEQPVEVRSCDPIDGTEPRLSFWIRPRGTLPDDPLLHAAVLVYASDRSLMSTASRPHARPDLRRRAASLDHSVWLHHTPRFDDWHLYTTESPVAHRARAFCLGAIYARDGARVASIAQEGLIRYQPRNPSQDEQLQS